MNRIQVWRKAERPEIESTDEQKKIIASGNPMKDIFLALVETGLKGDDFIITVDHTPCFVPNLPPADRTLT